MSDFLQALAAARDEYRQEEYVDRIKKLIRAKIHELDEAAIVEDTHYFNHSAIPDFVVTWRGEKAKRDLYLRGSYAAIVASNDVEATSAGEPVFMSLDATQDFTSEMPPISPQMIRDEPRKAAQTLLTDVKAMGEMLEPDRSRATPLTRLVKASFVRGGRGLIDEPRAEALVEAEAGLDPKGLADVVRESFAENIAARMERTATIVALALGEGTDLDAPALAKLTGRLSETELQEILPWLLRQDRPVGNPAFWRQFGSMTSFRDLEKIAVSLEGLDLGPLMVANADTWEAQRAYLGVSSLLAEEPENGEIELGMAVSGWSFRSGVLGVDAGIHRVMFSADGRILKGRDDGGFPRWEDLKRTLSSFQLSSVNLKGVTRSVRIDAEESDDIRQDVEDVAESLDDSYSVSELGLRFSPRETKDGYASVVARFGKGLAISSGGATIADLARSSLQVLAYRSPLSPDKLGTILAYDETASSFLEIDQVSGRAVDWEIEGPNPE